MSTQNSTQTVHNISKIPLNLTKILCLNIIHSDRIILPFRAEDQKLLVQIHKRHLGFEILEGLHQLVLLVEIVEFHDSVFESQGQVRRRNAEDFTFCVHFTGTGLSGFVGSGIIILRVCDKYWVVWNSYIAGHKKVSSLIEIYIQNMRLYMYILLKGTFIYLYICYSN